MSVDQLLVILEEINEKLDQLLARGTISKGTINTTVKEEVEQDFSKVTVMNQTDKALLVVKNGYQQWLAKQFIKNANIDYTFVLFIAGHGVHDNDRDATYYY